MKKSLTLFAAALCAGSLLAEMEYATPESQGVDSAAILRWIDACEKTFDSTIETGALHGFVLVRHGKTIAEGTWKPFDTLNETHMLYSHSKSFTSSAIGFLVDEGKLDLDERVVAIFSNDAPAQISENLAQLRVRDLLTMNAGKKDHLLRDGGNWVQQFLAKDFVVVPGTLFRYDSDATYMLAAIAEEKSGLKMMDYLKAKMFDKIGIAKAWTTFSPQGIPCGGWGMNMTTRELARFGQLYLQKGMWGGEELLSAEWVALATARQTWCNGITIQSKTIGSGSDWTQGYGFQFWRCRHKAYRADGAYGQYTIVMPEEDAVLSIHAGLGDMQKELNLVWDNLLPAFKAGALVANPSAEKALRERCAALAIAPIKGKDPTAFLNKTYAFKKNSRGFVSLRLERAENGIVAKLVTRVGEQTFPVGNGTWERGTLRIDPENYEGLGGYVGEHKTAASCGVNAVGALHLRAYLTGDTGLLDFTFAAGGRNVTGEFWAMRGCKLESAE